MSVHSAELSADGLELVFLIEVVGWGTEMLSSLAPGEEVELLGPLGRAFDISKSRKALLVAGGVGIAPLYFLAKEFESSGESYELLAGFKTGEKCLGGLGDLQGEVTIYTEDGSTGTCGKVCDDLAQYLERDFDSVFTCGPETMMAEVARLCEGAGVPCQVSLEERMACGIGACRGCVREGTGGKNLCVCTDGPVFDSGEVAWRAD